MEQELLQEAEKETVKLNPYRARTLIEELNNTICKIQNEFVNDSSEYCSQLSKLWWSPRAIAFHDKLSRKVDDINRELKYLCESTINDACSSFNSIATARGTGSIYVKAGPFLGYTLTPFKETDEAGKVGMIISIVKNCTNEYVEILNKLERKVDKIPRNIGFYDMNGTLVKTYNTRLDKIMDVVDTSISLIEQEVSISIDEEVNLEEKAEEKALDTLSNK